MIDTTNYFGKLLHSLCNIPKIFATIYNMIHTCFYIWPLKPQTTTVERKVQTLNLKLVKVHTVEGRGKGLREVVGPQIRLKCYVLVEEDI